MSREFLEWCFFQRHLMAIEALVVEHGFTWCSDEYPMIEILDKKGINTLKVFEFKDFDDLENQLKTI